MKIMLEEVLIKLTGEEMKQLSEEIKILHEEYAKKDPDNYDAIEEKFPLTTHLECVWWDFPENKDQKSV